MKHFLIVLSMVLASACSTPVGSDPQAQFLKAAVTATQLVDQVVLAADAAVRAGALKGQDAQATLAAVKAAQAGITAATSLAKTDPAQALSSLGVATATLAAVNTYLVTLGASK